MTSTHPFGPPVFLVAPRITRVRIDDCLDPAAFHRRFRAQLPAGEATCLLESSDAAAGLPARSVIATCCPLRLDLEPSGFRITALRADAGPLLAALGRGLPGAREDEGSLLVPVAGPATDWTLADAERLRAPDCLDPLRRAAGLVADQTPGAPLAAGLFGVLGFEIVDRFDRLPPRRPDPMGEPDASFVLALDLVVYDHVAGEVIVTSRPLPGGGAAEDGERHARVLELLRGPCGARPAPARGGEAGCPVQADVSRRAFVDAVAAVKEHILRGDVFQTVLSRGFEMTSEADSLDVYAALRQSNPSPYMFHFDLAEGSLLGASPETFLKVDGQSVEIRPIAGTVPRGTDAETDLRLALQLRLDAKEQAEHAMLLDLARNDVARIAAPGTMHVEQQFEVERYSHVQHLVSRVRGQLRQGFDALHAYRAVANMGTLTGAPKLRAMELIRSLEATARGFYGGAAGYLLQDGQFDSCIVIRSLRHRDGRFVTRAGAGVVHGSDPERECAETEHKAGACIAAVAAADAAIRTEVAS